MTSCIGRPFKFYDGRKTGPNIVKKDARKLGMQVSNDEIAKLMTRNKPETLAKFYLLPDTGDEHFKAVDALNLVRSAHSLGYKQNQST